MTEIANEQAIAGQIPAISRIENDVMRQAVIRTWQSALQLSEFGSIESASQSAAFPSRSLLYHVNEVAELAIRLLDLAETYFGLAPDRDVVIAAAILHDVDKLFICRRLEDGGLEYREGYDASNHGSAGADLAKKCGLNEKVVELIRNHPPFTYTGEMPANAEGTIVHYADLAAADLGAVSHGATPIHSRSLIIKKENPILRDMFKPDRLSLELKENKTSARNAEFTKEERGLK